METGNPYVKTADTLKNHETRINMLEERVGDLQTLCSIQAAILQRIVEKVSTVDNNLALLNEEMLLKDLP